MHYRNLVWRSSCSWEIWLKSIKWMFLNSSGSLVKDKSACFSRSPSWLTLTSLRQFCLMSPCRRKLSWVKTTCCHAATSPVITEGQTQAGPRREDLRRQWGASTISPMSSHHLAWFAKCKIWKAAVVNQHLGTSDHLWRGHHSLMKVSWKTFVLCYSCCN